MRYKLKTGDITKISDPHRLLVWFGLMGGKQVYSETMQLYSHLTALNFVLHFKHVVKNLSTTVYVQNCTLFCYTL